MTAHHRHPLDRLRADPPPEDANWTGADFEADGSDILEMLDATALYDGDGDLYGLRIGRKTFSEADLKLMLDPAHFARIQHMDAMTLDTARRE